MSKMTTKSITKFSGDILRTAEVCARREGSGNSCRQIVTKWRLWVILRLQNFYRKEICDSEISFQPVSVFVNAVPVSYIIQVIATVSSLLNLCDSEYTVTSYSASRIHNLATPRRLIVELGNGSSGSSRSMPAFSSSKVLEYSDHITEVLHCFRSQFYVSAVWGWHVPAVTVVYSPVANYVLQSRAELLVMVKVCTLDMVRNPSLQHWGMTRVA